MPKADHRLNALRILFIFVRGSEPHLDDAAPDYVRAFDGETKTQALDFWFRYASYLADELLTIFEHTSDKWALQEAKKIFSTDEPDVRRVPMLRKYFGAYEPIDTVLGILKSRGLILPKTKPTSEFANHRIFLVSKRACDLVDAIPKNIPELQWYEDRVRLILKVAGQRGGETLKKCQHAQEEYHKTKAGDLIPDIATRVRLRLQELDK